MGVPAFYRWLSEKYPKIVTDVLEQRPFAIEGHPLLLPDARESNPSGLETDNFYIDLNGVIHPCSHPESGAQPKTELEMYDNVCKYIDRLFNCVRPRKVLYIAIDGVAPRAKMNQQRARRFRSAQEAREQAETAAQVQADLMAQGLIPASMKTKVKSEEKAAFDSNTITPGTMFMYNLSKHLQAYIHQKVSSDPAWQSIKILFSDASIPGEGEHKIMHFIRCQRAQPGYNPNTVHCLHGLDADLIMLALATHELHFYILREEVLFGRKGAELSEKRKAETGFTDEQKALDAKTCGNGGLLPKEYNKPLQRLSVPVLREYLMLEFGPLERKMPYPFDFERIIDDIVFFSFFVGNDFLPHLPSLDIRDGALDFLFNVYKRCMPSFPKNYLTYEGGGVNLVNVDIILAEVGAIESYVFAMRHKKEGEDKRRREMQKRRAEANKGTAAQKSQRDGQALRRHLENGGDANAGNEQRKRGRAGRALVKQEDGLLELGNNNSTEATTIPTDGADNGASPTKKIKLEDNESAASALKAQLSNRQQQSTKIKQEEDEENEWQDDSTTGAVSKRSNDNSTTGPESDASTIAIEKASPDAIPSANTNNKDSNNEAKPDEIASNAVPDAVVSNNNDNSEKGNQQGNENKNGNEPTEEGETVEQKLANAIKAANQQKLDEYAASTVDNIRLHDHGYKDRYYTDKCKAEDIIEVGGRDKLIRNYIVGLCWIMQYYYRGVPSWKWFYPSHYAPFASDLINIEQFENSMSFSKGEPFTPIEQLLAVLPSSSCEAVPQSSRWLMTDQDSPIFDYYPYEVKVDPNGKAMPWLWVVLLPFINETRLISAYRPTKEKWMDEERKLEVRGAGEALLFVHNNCMAMDMLEDKKAAAAGDDTKRKHKRIKNKSHDGRNQPMIPLGDAQRWDGFTGLVRSEDVPKIKCSDDDVSTEECTTSSLVHIVAFESPRCLKHRSTILRKARPPPAKLTESDANICKPRINRGANIAYMGTTPFRAVDYDHFQMHSRSNRAPPPAPSYHNSNAPFHRQGPPPRFTPAPQQQQHLPGMRNPFVAQHNNHNQHQHHHHHHRQFPPPPPHPGNPGHHFGGPPPPSAPTFRFQHPNGSNNNHNYGGRQHPPQNFNHGPPRPSAPRFTFSNPRGSQPPPRPPQQQQQQQQQHRMSDLRNQLRSTLNGGRGARHVRGPQSNHGQQQSRRY